MSVDAREPITLPPTERDQVRELERMLDLGAPALISVSGERLVVPPTVYEVLRKVVELMAEGKAVTLLPDNQVSSLPNVRRTCSACPGRSLSSCSRPA